MFSPSTNCTDVGRSRPLATTIAWRAFALMPDIVTYAMLFAVAFGAATILPLQSEVMLVGLLLADY